VKAATNDWKKVVLETFGKGPFSPVKKLGPPGEGYQGLTRKRISEGGAAKKKRLVRGGRLENTHIRGSVGPEVIPGIRKLTS